MRNRTKILLGVAVLVVAAGVPAGIAIANADDDTPITGPALEEASRAALEYLGEGRVTDTEVGDEESYYEVEVTLDDGTEVDVQLDESFVVVGSEKEGVDRNETDGDGD